MSFPNLPIPPLMGATDVSRHLRERRTCARAPTVAVLFTPMKTVRTKCRTPARSSLVLDHRLSGSTGRPASRTRRTVLGERPATPADVPVSGVASRPSSHAQDTRPAGVTSTGASFPASSSRSPCSLWLSCGPGCWPPAVRLADVRSAWNRAGGSRLSPGWSASKRQRTLSGHACSRRSRRPLAGSRPAPSRGRAGVRRDALEAERGGQNLDAAVDLVWAERG